MAALIIGIVLGLIGGGGSILTVPVFVYLLGISPVIATGYSLFVVGITSLIGGSLYARKGLVDVNTAVVFAIPAFISVYLTRRYLIPVIPDIIFETSWFTLTRGVALMLFFGVIMLLAAYSMIREKNVTNEEESGELKFNYPLILIEGLFVWVITGLVGAGGGFIIIPALVLLAKLPMKKAVGTSLIIIAVKSLIGFIGDVQNIVVDWNFLLVFSGIAIVGILIGIYLNNFIPGKKLKKSFGWFVIVMAVYILLKELVL